MDLTLRGGRTVVEDAIVDALWLQYGFRYPPAADAAALRAIASEPMPDRALRFVAAKGVTYIWRRFDAHADDGDQYVQPADVSGSSPGRWVKTISAVQSGYLKRCELYNDDESDLDTIEERIFGQVPAVLVSYEGQDHVPKSLRRGALYWTPMRFTLLAASVSLRGSQTARQGSLLAAEAAVDPGTAAMIGDVKATLAGYDLGLRDVAYVEIGAEQPQIRDLARMRFCESLDLVAYVTLTNQDTGLTTVDDFAVQFEHADFDQSGKIDPDNVLTSGIAVPVASGLTQPVYAGSAVVGGVAVAFPGEMRTFAANSDTYRDLLSDGTMIYARADNGAPQPPVTSTAMRVGVTVTDATGVVADRILCGSEVPFGDVNQF